MLFVIGSGPAGVSCAAALIEHGYQVTLLDAGIELEDNKKEQLELLSLSSWTPKEFHSLNLPANHNDELKLAYGSHYPYEKPSEFFDIYTNNELHCLHSFAKGGFSNIWGAVIERYSKQTLQNWPKESSELELYYQKVAKLIFSESDIDPPEKMVDTTNHYTSSLQAKFLLSNLSKHKMSLKNHGISFGLPELAVYFRQNTKNACRYCGLCQYGCPGQYIYSANKTLQELQRSGLIYLQNVVVTAIKETDNQVIIYAHDRLTKKNLQFAGKKVFSACGPLISTQLFLKSTQTIKKKIVFKDSSYFMFPIFLHQPIKNVRQEKLHTLCQAFLRINACASKQDIYLQYYSYMDHYLQKLQYYFKWGKNLMNPLTNYMLNRLSVIQGFLSSEDSHQFTLALDEHQHFHLNPIQNSDVNVIIHHLFNKLKQCKKELGFTAIPFLKKFNKIGQSCHYGGSLPMREFPNEFETDTLGRPFAFKHWHIVDAAIFPSIPAGPITLTIMANAYRIGHEVASRGREGGM